jgi:hypothetical protein
MVEQKPLNKEKQHSPWRTYRWHAVLLALMLAECLVALMLHRSTDELQSTLSDGTGRDQVEALFVLTNRDVPMDVDEELIQSLWQSDNALMREWIMTANFARFGEEEVKTSYIESLGDSEAAFRCRLFLNHQVGKPSLLTLQKVDRFIEGVEIQRSRREK